MTLIVGVRCTNGVVIGTDSAATFGPINRATISQPFLQKIEVIDNQIIIAGTGPIGLGQRFVDIASSSWAKNEFKETSPVDIGRILSRKAIKDFQDTGLKSGMYGALMAIACKPKNHTRRAELIEFEVPDFQPEVKTRNLWYASMGSGQSVADPLLGFVRKTFWGNEPPTCQDGIFAATMVLKLACEMDTGGVAEPIQMALLESEKGQFSARRLSEDQLSEHRQNVDDAIKHFRRYMAILRGEDASKSVPQPSS